jgi:hypothetical protein
MKPSDIDSIVIHCSATREGYESDKAEHEAYVAECKAIADEILAE